MCSVRKWIYCWAVLCFVKRIPDSWLALSLMRWIWVMGGKLFRNNRGFCKWIRLSLGPTCCLWSGSEEVYGCTDARWHGWGFSFPFCSPVTAGVYEGSAYFCQQLPCSPSLFIYHKTAGWKPLWMQYWWAGFWLWVLVLHDKGKVGSVEMGLCTLPFIIIIFIISF